VTERKRSNVRQQDYLQALIDAEADTINLNFDSQSFESFSNVKITEKKMNHNVILSFKGFKDFVNDYNAALLFDDYIRKF
jgi:hypothetical protein